MMRRFARRCLFAALACAIGPMALAGPPGLDVCEIQQIEGPGIGEINFFGVRVALTRDHAVIGTTGEALDAQGSAHVYRLQGGQLRLQEVLHSGTSGPNTFGFAIAATDSLIAVGDYSETTDVVRSGAVHLYDLSSGSPVFQQRLTASDAGEFERFGVSVAVAGETVVVGAQSVGVDRLESVGRAYVFRLDGGRWIEEAILDDPTPTELGLAGFAVAVAGDVAMVGVPGDGANEVLAFRRVDGAWTFEQALSAPGGDSAFGNSVVLDASATIAVIGAPDAFVNDGAVYVFEHDGVSWVPQASLQAANPVGLTPSLGGKVALSDDASTIISSAPGDQELGGGAVHFFRKVDDEWQEIFKLMRPGTTCLAGLATRGDLLLVGDPCGVVTGGEAYLFGGISGADCNGNGTADSCDIASGDSHDVDGDGIPDECPVHGDVDGDGAVSTEDLIGVILGWGSCPESCPADLNGDGQVDVEDLLIVVLAWTVPRPPLVCSGEDCCLVHAAPGCVDQDCCGLVCGADPFCCQTTWDVICVNAAQEACGCPPPEACGRDGAGDCCTVGGLAGPGCDDGFCCETICDFVDPFCCEAQWDETCAFWAVNFCDCPHFSCTPDSGDCCKPHPDQGCEDPACCGLICELDFFCCEVSWDGLCAEQAWMYCTVCGGDPPGE